MGRRRQAGEQAQQQKQQQPCPPAGVQSFERTNHDPPESHSHLDAYTCTSATGASTAQVSPDMGIVFRAVMYFKWSQSRILLTQASTNLGRNGYRPEQLSALLALHSL